jgi:two-component system OmpR family sensor kinase
MSSLRTRLLAGVLVLAAAGLVLVGVVTYAEQRSFLEGRVDQEAHSAVGALSQALDRAGFRPPEESGFAPGGGEEGPAPRGGPGGGPGVNLPPGTYGERRDATGAVLGHLLIKYSPTESTPAAPAIPSSVPLDHLFTVGSQRSSSLKYRVYARRDPEDAGITVAAVPLREVQATLDRLRVVEALVILGVLLALGLTGFFVIRFGLRPLDRMERTAGEIAAGKLSRRVSPANRRTEVGRLGLALNAMLERLERAFSEREGSEERLRRFLADASHELRTPLASIRGYAELFRIGAARTPAETENAMRRIEEEAARMGVLVEDLLTLARLDETREPVRERVDMTQLARDAVTDARAVAPDRAIAISAPDADLVTVAGDPHQLRQVLANLLRNALVHTPGDTAIEMTVAAEPEAVAVTVRDHGPGLPPGDPEQLFERFWRSQTGRERGRAGAGLGLAIVREIAIAHGGSIRAANADGGGAEFVLELPLLADSGRDGAARAPGSPAPSRS